MANEYSTEETTQELLQRLQDSLRNYRAKGCGGMTKEELKARYDSFEHISGTLKFYELTLLYYLRNSEFGTTYGFMKMAKDLYEASKELEEITASLKNMRAEADKFFKRRNT